MAEAPEPSSAKHATTSLYVRAQPGLRLRDKRVERLACKMRHAMPWLEPSDTPAVRAWAEIEYLCTQVYAALRTFGVLNREGECRRLLSEYRQMRACQAVWSRELGLTPAARIAIKATATSTALDLADAASERIAKLAPVDATSTDLPDD